MRCKICNKTFFVQRKLKNLLETQRYFICDDCYKKYKIDLEFNVIPLDDFDLIILSLFKEAYKFKGDPFIIEYSNLFNYAITHYKDEIIICEKNIYIDDKKLELFNNISKISKTSLVLICNAYVLK
ncbi:MAG: hypothetical protein K6G28_05275 [Acholeplasmatales bacterium]|nr:hypothetical protein [Acholeplasmatales bacterium]